MAEPLASVHMSMPTAVAAAVQVRPPLMVVGAAVVVALLLALLG